MLVFSVGARQDANSGQTQGAIPILSISYLVNGIDFVLLVGNPNTRLEVIEARNCCDDYNYIETFYSLDY